jgi:hypothetical protein
MSRRWGRITESFLMSVFFFFFAGACYYVIQYPIGYQARYWATIFAPIFVIGGIIALILGIYELLHPSHLKPNTDEENLSGVVKKPSTPSNPKRNLLKYVLVGSLLSSGFWILLTIVSYKTSFKMASIVYGYELGQYGINGYNFTVFDLQILRFICIIASVFFSIGFLAGIKKPSFKVGFIVGVISFLIIPFLMLPATYYTVGFNYAEEVLSRDIGRTLVVLFINFSILVGGSMVGIFLVRRRNKSAPKFMQTV